MLHLSSGVILLLNDLGIWEILLHFIFLLREKNWKHGIYTKNNSSPSFIFCLFFSCIQCYPSYLCRIVRDKCWAFVFSFTFLEVTHSCSYTHTYMHPTHVVCVELFFTLISACGTDWRFYHPKPTKRKLLLWSSEFPFSWFVCQAQWPGPPLLMVGSIWYCCE